VVGEGGVGREGVVGFEKKGSAMEEGGVIMAIVGEKMEVGVEEGQ